MAGHVTADGYTELGIGLISVGWMGKLHSRAYQAIPVVYPELKIRPRLVHAADSAPDRADYARDVLGYARGSTDYRAVLEDPDVDVVSICAPNLLHREIGIAAAEAGKPFWIEKPVGRDAADTGAVAAAARAAGVVTSIGYNYRHAPAVERIRDVIANGDLGRITNVRAVFFNGYASEPNGALSWRFKKDLAGSGALGDLLSHVVDLVQYVVGPITDVSALLSTVHRQRPILPMGSGTHFAVIEDGELGDVENDDYVGALVRFSAGSPGAGAVGTLEASRVIVGPQCGLGFEIYGTEGSASWNFERMNELQLSIGRTGPNQGYTTILGNQSQGDYAHFQPGPGNAMGYDDLKVIEAKKFLVAVTGGEQLNSTIDEALADAEVIAAAAASAADGQWHQVPAVPGVTFGHARSARSRSCLSRCRSSSGSGSWTPPWSPRCSPVGAASSPNRPRPTCARLRGPSLAPTPTSTPPSSTGLRGCGSSRGPASAWSASTWTRPLRAGSRSWSPPVAGRSLSRKVPSRWHAPGQAVRPADRPGPFRPLGRPRRGRVADLAGSTLGVVGFGRIGQHAGTLGAALGMKVLAYDPVAEPPAAYRCRHARRAARTQRRRHPAPAAHPGHPPPDRRPDARADQARGDPGQLRPRFADRQRRGATTRWSPDGSPASGWTSSTPSRRSTTRCSTTPTSYSPRT